ncbi:MAG: metalloregulator ArsR/SmtB family transcription factor [Erysipelotrichaceae bacterium]
MNNYPNELLIDLELVFKALSDKSRLKILLALNTNESTVSNLATTLNISQSTLSNQLRILKEAKLVNYIRQGQNIIYSLDDQHVKDILNITLLHIKE